MRQPTYNEFLLLRYQEAIKPYGYWIYQWIESSKCSLRKEEKELFHLLNESKNLRTVALYHKRSITQTQSRLRTVAIKIRQDYHDFRKWIISNREESFLTSNFASLEISSKLYHNLNSTMTSNLKELLEEYELKDLLKRRGFGKKSYIELITLLKNSNIEISDN